MWHSTLRGGQQVGAAADGNTRCLLDSSTLHACGDATTQVGGNRLYSREAGADYRHDAPLPKVDMRNLGRRRQARSGVAARREVLEMPHASSIDVKM